MGKSKSEIGFFRWLKNIYNKSPFLVGFISPIVWCGIIILLGPLWRPLIKIFYLEYTLLLQLFVAYVLFLIPNWVGVIISEKKLDYIISIILFGSFWLMGFITYDLMQSSSRINATKTIYSQTVKYISAELQKCSLGEITAMDGGLTCSNYTAAKAITVAVNKSKDFNFGKYRKNINPYKYSDFPVRVSNSNTNDEDVGYINLSASGSDIIIKSCNKTPCNNEANRQSRTVSIK